MKVKLVYICTMRRIHNTQCNLNYHIFALIEAVTLLKYTREY